jgi:hypothetical protein
MSANITTITDLIDSFIINTKNIDINQLQNEIMISKILLNIPQWYFYFLPILNNPSSQNKKYILIEKPQRNTITLLPNTHKNDIIEYLYQTTNLLLDNNIYLPINNNTIHFDNTNKIPLVIDFKNGSLITRWQNKSTFLLKYKENIDSLIFT